jgi:hypothetical protein
MKPLSTIYWRVGLEGWSFQPGTADLATGRPPLFLFHGPEE